MSAQILMRSQRNKQASAYPKVIKKSGRRPFEAEKDRPDNDCNNTKRYGSRLFCVGNRDRMKGY
jgi:hypothetical protein